MKSTKQLEKYHLCVEAVVWVRKQKSYKEVWDKCKRSDWMWWYLRKLNLTPKELSIAYSKACAKHAAHLDNYWSKKAADAANTAADAYATCAAYTAADAADAAYADTYAAAYADTYAAAYAADAAADAADAERKWQADLLRTLVKNPFDRKK